MAKAPSAEVGQKRYYHHVPAGAEPCACTRGKIDPKCPYALLSVTTILKALPKEWLGAWAAKAVAELAIEELGNIVTMALHEGPEAAKAYIKGAPWRRRDAAADRGTVVHAAAETGAAVEDVPEEARARLISWHRWLDDYQPDIEMQEATVYYPFHGYAGTADIIATLGDGRWLIDIKTGDVYWDQRLQQAAYRYASFIGDEDGNPVADVPPIDHVGILVLHDDGYSFYEVEAGEEEWDAFLEVAKVANYIDRLSRQKPRLVGTSKGS